VRVRCARCHAERNLCFHLLSPSGPNGPIRQINPTAEPSGALDVAEWMDLARFYLERIGRLRDAAQRAQSLLDARQCLEEALKFYGPEDAATSGPPPHALWSEASRQKVARQPDAYRRGTIAAMLSKIPPTERLRQADAIVQKEFRKSLKEKAQHRVGRRWWPFWKRGKKPE